MIEPMSEGLLRQRRNLIVVSALLWLLKFGGVKLNKMSLAGFDVEFARPEALPLCLWIAFFYFLYRYYQYLIPEGVPKLQHAFDADFGRYAQPSLDRYVLQKNPALFRPNIQSFGGLRHSKWVYKGDTEVRDPDGVVRRTQPFQMKIARSKFAHLAALALLNLLFRTSLATDYLLPLMLAGYVLWYCGTPDWSGSFVSLFFGDGSA